ncbi:MAG: hypothetical protein RR984_03135 [Bacilli bacterium]
MNDIKQEHKHYFRKIVILIILFIIIVFLYARFIGTKGVITKEYNIKNKMISNNFNGVKIIHFGDLLLSNEIDEQQLNKIVNSINKVKPDIVIFSGNLMYNIKKFTSKNEELLIKYLKKINPTMGSYYITGIMDKNKKQYDNIMSSSSFINIDNKEEVIYRNTLQGISLTGLMSDDKIILKENTYNIIVVNDDKNIDKILSKDLKPNLILGGNALNGSVIIPFYGPILLESGIKYYAPHYTKNNVEIFITSGIGTKKYNFRLNNSPSINFYRLTSLQ